MGKLKYNKAGIALLICFVGMIVFASQLHAIVEQVQDAILNGHWVEMVNVVELAAAQIDEFLELDNDWKDYDYSRDLGIMAGLLNARKGVFCAVYNTLGNLLSSKYVLSGDEAPDPFGSIAFKEAIDLYAYGELKLPMYSERSKTDVQSNCYYRWIPTGGYESQLLMVLYMSPDIMAGDTTARLVRWCTGLLVVAGLAIIVSSVTVALRKRREVTGSA